MAEESTFAALMSSICFAAGGTTAGFLSSGIWRQPPSPLTSRVSVGLGFLYGCACYLLHYKKDYALELALGSSVLLEAYAASRIIKTRGRTPLPLALGVIGGIATFYYQDKFRNREPLDRQIS